MRLLDRVIDRYRSGYWEGMASGASTLTTYVGESKREPAMQNLVAAAMQAYETNGVVFACTLVRMMMLSEATFKFRSLKDKHLYGNQDLSILEHPWPGATAGELWARMEQSVSTGGNAFVAKVEDDELLILPAHEVVIVSEVVTSSSGVRYKRPIGYDWDPTRLPGATEGKAAPQFFTTDEVAHWSPIPDPMARFRGMSWLSPVLREVASDSAMTAYKTLYMDHGSPVTAVKYDRALKPESVDYLMDRIAAKFGGVANAWRPLIFDQGAEPVLSAGLDVLDFRNVQAGGELRICAAAGVSPILIGMGGSTYQQASSGGSYSAAMRQLADMHLRPLWRSACAALQHLVPNVPSDAQLWFDTSDIAALQAAETEKAQVTQVSAAAILTFIQAGMTPESSVLAATSGDLTLLKPDPHATHGAAPKTGQGAGVQPVLTKPQTPASKMPMPSSLPTMPTSTGRPRGPSANGKG
jgi:phage portal protein BeeE